MSDKEIVMQLTLSAIEQGYLKADTSSDNVSKTRSQAFAQRVCEFYKTVFETVSHVDKENEQSQS